MSAYRLGERWPHRPGATGRVHVRRPAVRRVRRRHARLGAARERRPPVRPLVQVSPSARAAGRRFRGAERARVGRTRRGAMHAERARDAGRDLRGTRRREPESLACARLRRDGPQRPVRAAHAGGVLLQDLHVAAFGLAPLVRACHTPRSRPRSRTVRAGPRSLRPAVRTLRRARGRRRPGGPRRRARGVSVRRTRHALRRAARTRWLAARRARRDDRRTAGAAVALRCDRRRSPRVRT